MALTPASSWAILVIGAFALINGLAYMAFRIDKGRAIEDGWRVPERTLLFLALIGGWLGAKAAQRRFRHKTRKEPFRSHLNTIPVFGCLASGHGYSARNWPRSFSSSGTFDSPGLT